ncbi:MAG: hypothetical protein P8N31_07175 [Planctomycetota bacterium]|nr:hypothetical protein [Planctomycetota bacterium]
MSLAILFKWPLETLMRGPETVMIPSTHADPPMLIRVMPIP